MLNQLIKLRALLRLGVTNLIRVFFYRLKKKTGIMKMMMPIGESYTGDFLLVDQDPNKTIPQFENDTLNEADELLRGKVKFFSNQYVQLGDPPAWLDRKNDFRHWSEIGDFEGRDIKLTWEPSRFDWCLLLARAWRVSHDKKYIETCNRWINDWVDKNPVNQGPNWKCGQETAIRLIQVLLATYLVGYHKSPTDNLKRFIYEHCARIAPTIGYAIGQDNNHGTSEAAGLFIGGAWLAGVSNGQKSIKAKALEWNRLGRFWLENRVARLIESDGSFSQYSVNYHRVVVDTLSIVEFWRREAGLPPFSNLFYERAKSAVDWLYQMVDLNKGDAPNIGANDGARLFVLSSTSYRDYRPTVQQGAVLFYGQKVYEKGKWDAPLEWLGLLGRYDKGAPILRESRVFREGGYLTLHSAGVEKENSWCLIRYPRFRFRPGQGDGLHLDLWSNGVNLLRDAGSYSYNTEEPWRSYFGRTSSHNTIQFDGRNQMPKVGRFIAGEWLQAEEVGDIFEVGNTRSWRCSYRDYQGCRHRRTVEVTGSTWRVTDEIEGFKTNAILRWRLVPDNWEMYGLGCRGSLADLVVECNSSVRRCELVTGWESRHYMEKTEIPVLEVEVNPDRAVLTTEIKIKAN